MTDAGHRSGRAVVLCEQWLGSNSFAAMKALRRAGWAVQVAAEWEYVPTLWQSLPMRVAGRTLRGGAVREFNRELALAVERTGAEMLLVFKGTFVRGDTVRALRERGVATYCFFPDVSFRAHGPYIPDALPEYDWVFTTKRFGLDDMRTQLGVSSASVVLHAYDPDLHRPVQLTEYDRARYGCDASFIGTWSRKKEAMLAELRALRPSLRLRVWGGQWHRLRAASLREVVGGYPVAGEEYVRAIRASTVSLAILSEQGAGASSGDQVTSRTFHIPACEAPMLHERTPELLALFEEGRDVACFDSAAELAERLDSLLADAPRRQALAAAGRATVSARHSWDHRIREILERHEALRS